MVTPLDMRFAEKLTHWLDSHGLHDSQLAERAGISAASIGRYKEGKRDPRRAELVRLARAMGVSVDYLADDALDESPDLTQEEREVLQLARELGPALARRRLLGLPDAPGPRYLGSATGTVVLRDPEPQGKPRPVRNHEKDPSRRK